MKIKLSDVARKAGVGHATVDRVLNERGGVAPATAKRVIEAARALGLGRSLPTPYRSAVRIEVILGRKTVPLFARINDAFERQIPAFRDTLVIQRTFVDDATPERVARAIRKSQCNAIIVYGQENEAVIEAIAAVTSAGKPVVTLVSDLPAAPRIGYVGINHYSAGRAAAFFIARMAAGPGKVLALCSSLEYRAEAERVSGFRDGLADYGPALTLAAIIEGHDHELRTRTALADAIAATGGLAGIYNAGALNAALEATVPIAGPAPRPVIIAHDLTRDTIAMLKSGLLTVVIDQNPELQARQALDMLNARFGHAARQEGSPTAPYTLHVRDNI